MTRTTAHTKTIRLTLTALFMSMNILLCMRTFSLPVPGGNLYLCDAVISLAAILFNPWEAFVVGGVGSFLGDLLFYPVAAPVSLITHGLQAVVISLLSHYTLRKHPRVASGIGVSIGAVIMVTGYTLGKIFYYSTAADAWMKLPYEIVQGAVGAIFGMLLCWRLHVRDLFLRMLREEA